MSTRGSSGDVDFDFNSEQGVLSILQSIRASEIGTKEQRELRDIVFSYAHSRGDAGLRNELEKRLTQLGITPVSPQRNQKASDTLKEVVSGRRPTPTFKVTHRAPTKVATPEISPQQAKVDTPITSTAPVNSVSASAGETTFIPHNIPESVSSTDDNLPTAPPTTPSEPRAVPVKITPRIPDQSDEKVPTNTPRHPATAPKAQSAIKNQIPKQKLGQTDEIKNRPQVDKLADNNPIQVIDQNPQLQVYLDRIRDIKTDINTRVGNPVNLVDIDNETGREYMSALLEAMKQISGGNNPVDAMQRLETSYKKALSIISPDTTADNNTQTNQVLNELRTVPSIQNVAVPANHIPTNLTNTNFESDKPEQSKSTYVKPLQVARDLQDQAQPKSESPIPPAVTEQDEEVTEQAVAEVPVSKKVTPLETDSLSIYEPEPESVKVTISPPVANDIEAVKISSSRFNLGSVADAPPLKNPEVLPTAGEVNTAEVGADPLYTKEVDDGLTQLLMEWPLFNKSGFLGRGPKGREHPLFIQLASMPIPLILSGRFEGSEPYIMQSVSDYMNGWRYEQGVVYTENEPFEHYLRRVVKHIIDWQRKKKKA